MPLDTSKKPAKKNPYGETPFDRVRAFAQTRQDLLAQGMAANDVQRAPVSRTLTPAPAAVVAPVKPAVAAAVAQPNGTQPVAAAPATAAASPVRGLPSTRPLQVGDPNTFTGSNGVTKAVPGLLNAPAAPPAAARTLQPVVASNSFAPEVQATTQRTLQGQRDAARTTRADAGEMLNPMSNGGEIMRRLEISQGSYQNKGRPSARAAIAQALLGQLGAQNQASAAGQNAANDTLQAGAVGEGVANERFAQRRLDANTFNVNAQQRNDELAVERTKPTGERVRGLNGVTSVLRNDGTATALRDESGAVIETPDAPAPGQLNDKDILDAFNTAQESIMANTMAGVDAQGNNARQAALDQLRSSTLGQRYDKVLGTTAGAAPAAGTVKDGFRFKGGNPADPASWEKVK